MTTKLGDYTAGEIPEPLVVTFTDAAGDAIDLTGYTARWVYQPVGGTAVTRNAVVTTPASGVTTHTWVAADLEDEGTYNAQMWVGNLTNRYASETFQYRVNDGPGPVPAI
jgi:hypothetical protein